MRCDKCKLHTIARNVCLESKGDFNSKIMIVGNRPTLEDDKLGTVFSLGTGNFVDNLLKSAGIDTTSCYYTYAIKCFSGLAKKAITVPEAHPVCTEAWLTRELDKLKPSLIITFGMEAYRSVTDMKSRTKAKDVIHTYTRGDHTYYVLALPAIYSLQQLSAYSLHNIATSIRKASSVVNLSLIHI